MSRETAVLPKPEAKLEGHSISYYEVREPKVIAAPFNPKPHLLVFCDNYFIALCLLVRIGKDRESITVSAPLNKDEMYTWYRIEPRPTLQEHKSLRMMYDNLFLYYTRELQQKCLNEGGLVISESSSIVSDRLYTLINSERFTEFVISDIQDRYKSLLADHEKTQEEAKAANEFHIAPLNNQLTMALRKLKTLIHQQQERKKKLSPVATTALDQQIEICEGLFRSIPFPRQRPYFDKLVAEVDILRTKFALPAESEKQKKQPKPTLIVDKKSPTAVTPADAKNPVESVCYQSVLHSVSREKEVPADADSTDFSAVIPAAAALSSATVAPAEQAASLTVHMTVKALPSTKETRVLEETVCQLRQQLQLFTNRLREAEKDKQSAEKTQRESAVAVKRLQVECDALAEKLKLAIARCKKLGGELQQAKSNRGRAEAQHKQDAANTVKYRAEIASLQLQLQAHVNTKAQREAEIARLRAQLQDVTASTERELTSLRAQHMRALGEQQLRLRTEHQQAVISLTRTTEENQRVIAELQEAFRDTEAKWNLQQLSNFEVCHRQGNEITALRRENMRLTHELQEARSRENRHQEPTPGSAAAKPPSALAVAFLSKP